MDAATGTALLLPDEGDDFGDGVLVPPSFSLPTVDGDATRIASLEQRVHGLEQAFEQLQAMLGAETEASRREHATMHQTVDQGLGNLQRTVQAAMAASNAALADLQRDVEATTGRVDAIGEKQEEVATGMQQLQMMTIMGLQAQGLVTVSGEGEDAGNTD